MKRMVFGALAALIVFTAGALAQDRIFSWQVHRDSLLPEHPCGANGIQGSVQPFFYDRQAMLFYTCNDGRVYRREFFNTNDQVVAPIPVFTVPDPSTPSSDGEVDRCARMSPGFVPGRAGGCVPGGSPLAR